MRKKNGWGKGRRGGTGTCSKNSIKKKKIYMGKKKTPKADRDQGGSKKGGSSRRKELEPKKNLGTKKK